MSTEKSPPRPQSSGAIPTGGDPENDTGYFLTLCLAALGIVYGDIGTSPLYAMRECFDPRGAHHVDVSQANVLGVVSLVLWSLVVVVAVKYLCYVMYADFNGEGGILALMALVTQGKFAGGKRRPYFFVAMGLFGAALIYGDGILTPAISVLSAVEGLNVATTRFEPYVIPITIVILFCLFGFQRHGTEKVGRLFGPVTLLWFLTLGLLGIVNIVDHPTILWALDPREGISFLHHHQAHGFIMLGAVFLAVTGGEALYADMGHFGRKPIATSWFAVVMPCLMLNYFGQGALLLSDPSAANNPFYKMAPTWALYPLVLLATCATIIASQALISGTFSLTRQAVMLGYWPRVTIKHTSPDEIGQVYIPEINWALMIATIAVVLHFQSSTNLAAAYGIAVATTMLITTTLAHFAAQDLWGWSAGRAFAVTSMFLVLDVAFFGANATKIMQGGWFPLLIALLMFTLMTTWKRGREILWQRMKERTIPWDQFLQSLKEEPPARVRGVAVFMTGSREGAPPALVHNLEHNRVLHDIVLLVSVTFAEVPRVADAERITIERLENGFARVQVRYGFTESADIPRIIHRLQEFEFEIDPENVTYFLGRETLIPTRRPGMALWREQIFAYMSRNALQATNFFNIPPDRVMEIGIQVEM